MSTSYCLAIDVGTSSTRAIVLDRQGNILLQAQQSLEITRHDASRIEQDADEILAKTQSVIAEVIAEFQDEIQCAGIATQRSSVVMWDKQTGQALSPILSWQDTRVRDSLHKLNQFKEDIKSRSGLVLSPHYGAGKMRWLLDNVIGINERLDTNNIYIAPLVSFLLFHLIDKQPYLLDESNAARTQLWNLRERVWDAELAKLFTIPLSLLPEVKPIISNYGTLKNSTIPVTAVCGDQTAAVNGVGPLEEKSVVINIGTGAFILLPTGKVVLEHARMLNGVLRSDEHGIDYLIEATVNGAAAALAWAKENYCNDLSDEDFQQKLAQWLSDVAEPPLFLNTIGGLGSPWWISGLDPDWLEGNKNCAQAPGLCIAAVIESIVFMLAYNLEILQQDVESLETAYLSGGLSSLDELCQRLADISGLQIKRLSNSETTALGVLKLSAAVDSVKIPHSVDKIFKPKLNAKLLSRYHLFIKRIYEKIQSTS